MDQSRSAVIVAANLSILAGLVHLLATPEHFEEWWLYGVFFAGMTLFQLGFAMLLMRAAHRNGLVLAGIAANLAIVAVYVVSRTAGLPIGPEAQEHHHLHGEAVGLLDMGVTLAEVALILVLTTLLDRGLRRRTMNALLVTGASMWVLRFAGVLA